tara:strand:+ start:229 stop:789 length:561 start_codon:yes stop_codon:yes gene_type:complete
MIHNSSRGAPFPYQVKVGIGKRDPALFPVDDEQLALAIFSRLEQHIPKGLPRPTALALGIDQVFQYDLLGLLKSGADLPRFLASIAGQTGVEVVATMGIIRLGPPASRRLAAMTYLEWPDSRWWSAIRPLDGNAFNDEWPGVFRSAMEGYPRPSGVGGWYSRSRREGLRLQLKSTLKDDLVSPVVH